jgi:hypothetical protein
VRVLLSVQRASFLKNFDSVVRLLAERGHEVLISIAQPSSVVPGQESLIAELTALPRVTIEEALPLREEHQRGIARGLRGTLDYFTFLEPRFPESYRTAWEPRAARPARLVGRSRLARRALTPLLGAAESSVQPSPGLVEFLRERRPDVLLITPHSFPRSTQPDLLRAARALEIPTGVCVHSWDNLSSKARIRLRPDRLFVWNELQRREAVELHGLPESLVAVTGAQAFDAWFDWQPRPREEFCARIGLDPAEPIVLYACSAPWMGRIEAHFLGPWIEALRAAGGQLASAGILIRPHPKRFESLPQGLPQVAVWPAGPELPGGRATRADYFDSLYHCSALVGVNTSAMIEAAILRKPVLTLSLPEFTEEHDHTLHFRYLQEVAGGVLTTARDLDEHVEQLAGVLADPEPAARQADAFTRVFVRPYGLDVAATPRFADEVERLAAERPAPEHAGPQALAVRGLLLAGAGGYFTLRGAWRAAKTVAGRRAPGTDSPPPAAATPELAAPDAPDGGPNGSGRAETESGRSPARTGRAG